MIVIVCPICKEDFTDYETNNRLYCSRRCYWDSMKGKKPSIEITDEIREQRRQRMLGENNPMWAGGDSDADRRNSQYKQWRLDVFNRDDFTCQDCGYVNGRGKKRRDLNAHHLARWIDSVELRYEVDNGITLCVPCHIKRHTNNAT